jgi:hypothetical protein
MKHVSGRLVLLFAIVADSSSAVAGQLTPNQPSTFEE